MFICTFDPFKQGLPQYTFTEICEETSELKLKDGTTKIFYNCCYEGEALSTEVKELYDYIRNGRVTNSLTKRIEEAVEKGRKNKMLRSEYLKERQILMDEREEGREEGRAEGQAERDALKAENERLHAEIERLKAAAL